MSQICEVSGSGDIEQVPVLSLTCNDRTENLRRLFAAQYEQEPEFYVRVPGRYELMNR